LAARAPGPPKNVLPRFRKPPSKLGINDSPDPPNELEKPERPKDEFPKSEPPMPDTPKREPPKFPEERPEENDENDVNRVDAGRFGEK